MDDDVKEMSYFVIRLIEVVCAGAFVFGLLWEGTLVMNLSTPQFLMVYGGVGALLSEVIARLIKKNLK